MKFIVATFTLAFVLAAEGSLAVPKPHAVSHNAVPKVAHVSAQSTIPKKTAHAHAVSSAHGMAVAALTKVKASNAKSHNSSKPSTESASATTTVATTTVATTTRTTTTVATTTVATTTVAKQTKEVKTANATAAAHKTDSHATPVVKEVPTAPHALVGSTAQERSHSKSLAALGAQNKAEYQLLNFLAAEIELEKKKEIPPFDVYLPACLDHTHKLIDALDSAYTDIQLHSVLVDECWLKKSFPKSHDSSFSTDSACKQFAKNLMDARYLELQNGSQEGYKGFCADYYVHIGGNLGEKKKAEAPPKPKPAPTQSFPWHFVIVAAAILILFAIVVCLFVKRGAAA